MKSSGIEVISNYGELFTDKMMKLVWHEIF